ncbi:hypothetical protein M413DRAFT_21084 [Hebeloma cylindrosporum]|uniref:BRCT domain-containing protein n=1 Tax=Hebeloma cylindrosporum TaxID=76867 RepID=A0A0C2YGA3_HEBCY|nr:hypothetical protein M413DRAFT_21084 [Hebeloma cylindrosporum h7]
MARAAQEDERVASPEPSQDKTLFTDEAGFPIAFFLHESIKRGSRPALIQDIESHGGRVLDSDEGADTVLVSRDFSKKNLQWTYHGHRNPRLAKIFVEPSTFVRHCIQYGRFYHKKPQVKKMGGRLPGRYRVEFTEDDDEKLCQYLSRILPDKESGGRQGLKVYQALCACAEHKPVEYKWALRHTPESWKERYKKFAPQFDKRISELAKRNPGVEHAWPEDRRMPPSRLRGVIELDSDGEEVEEGQVPPDDDEERSVPASPPKRRRSGPSDLPTAKRVRVSSPSHRPSQRRRSSATSKGKEKAVEEEEEELELDAEYELEGTSLFSRGDLEDLTGDFRSPVRNFADDGHAVRSSPEYLTQNTLIGTASYGGPSNIASTSGNRTRDGEGDDVPPPIPNTQPHRQPRSTVYVDLRSPLVKRTRGSQPQPQSSPPRAAPEPPQPTPPTPPPAQPYNTYKRPMKAARRPPEFIQQVTQVPSGPYRNTRSRSRSVEPPPIMPPVAKRQQGRKDKLKQADVILEEELEEDILVEESITPVGETLAEERDVENLLNAANQEASIIAPVAASPRSRSMESDDAQVARNLREGSVASSRVAPAKGFGSRLMHPDEFLRRMEMSTSRSSRHSMPFNPIQIPFGQNTLVPSRNEVSRHRPRQSEPLGLRRNTHVIFRTPDPYTPQQRAPKSPGSVSVSSAESFPLSGTHASAYKRRLRQLEKRSPYKPPAGTRAAELVMNNQE